VQRIIVGRSATLTRTFSFTPTGTPSVAVVRSDGTTVTVGTPSGTGATWSYTIPASSNTQLDVYAETWTAVTGGEGQAFSDVVEVAGGAVFTLADARADRALGAQNNDSSYRIADAEILAMRTEVEDRLERELAFAMVPRYAAETLSGEGCRELVLKWPYVRAIRSVTVNDTAFSVSDLAAVSVGVTGILYFPGGWSSGRENVIVEYEHGLASPPAGARTAALALAKRWLVGAPADDRAQTMSTDEATTTFYVPGASEPFDVPLANRFVASNTLRVGLA